MNIFTIFFYNISAKYSPKRTKLHNFKKFSRGTSPRTPLAIAWPRHANTPTFPKIF